MCAVCHGLFVLHRGVIGRLCFVIVTLPGHCLYSTHCYVIFVTNVSFKIIITHLILSIIKDTLKSVKLSKLYGLYETLLNTYK